MTTRRVTTPTGTVWRVRRRWLPHRPNRGLSARIAQRRRRRARRRDDGSRWHDWLDLGLEGIGVPGDAEVLAVVLLAVVAIVLFVLFGWTVVLLGIDLVLLLVVAVLGFVGRVVLRRPWRVEATTSTNAATERRDWFVVGYRAAGRWRDELANRFRHGADPAPDDRAPPGTLGR